MESNRNYLKMHKKKPEPLSATNSKLNSILSSGILNSSSTVKKNNFKKSLVDASNMEMIQLSHDQINFINTDQNQIYEIVLSVRNVTNKSIPIKFTKPKSAYLSVTPASDQSLKKSQQNSQTGMLITKATKTQKRESSLTVAPGLEIKLVIVYNSEINEAIKDKITIFAEEGSFEQEVPINVYPVVNYLKFKGFADFGVIKPNDKKEITIEIKNQGKNTAEVKLSPNIHSSTKAILMLSEDNLLIDPECKASIIATLSSSQIGQVEGIIQILPHHITESYIQFCGVFCDSNRFIASQEGEEISELQLMPLFAGQTKEISLFLTNNTPKKCEFRIIRKKVAPIQQNDPNSEEQDNYCLITPEQYGRDDEYEEKIIKFMPFQGWLDPYSKLEINCQVLAKFEESDYQLFCNYAAGKIKILPYQSSQWSYTIKTYFSDEDPPKSLTIKGQSMIPKLCLSAVYFQFGELTVRKKLQKTLRIQNFSDQEITIQLQKSSNYKFNVSNCVIGAGQFKDVNVIFMPQVCGLLKEICYLKAGEFSFPFRVFGKGIFVQPQKNLNQNETPKMLQECSTPNQWESEEERAIELPPEDLDMPPEISIIREKDAMDETQNKSLSYNFDSSILKFKLGKSEKNQQRVKRTVKNRNGKQTVVQVNNFNEDQEVEEYPGCGRNVQEDRLVMRELTLQEFRNISVGPVVINFGEVFVQTPQKKTFHICNFNSKPISIQLEVKNQPEFDESSKSLQMIPPESHGGISIIFQGHRQGSFKFPLQYIINNRHYFQILATGTAILPTVKFSKADFKFLANEQDPCFEKREELVLKNVYPYEVHFTFIQEKDSHFKVIPESGKILPNSKKQVSLHHSFLGILQGGGKIEETLKLKIKNGQKFDIKCTSIVPDAAVTCKPNQLSFKEVSICKYHEMKFSIRNPSKNFTIFKVISNKDLEGSLTIQANKVQLSPDEVAEVSLKLYCSKQQVIDSGVTVIVRGGKNVFIPIKASIIIPKIRVESETINFGSMPVSGNPNIKQISLINESAISAELDLVLQNDSFLYRCLSIKEENNQFVCVQPPKQIKDYKVKIYTIKLVKKCKAQIYLEFVPEQVKQYNFMLPLYLNGCSETFPSLQKNVICQSESDRLIIDHRIIDFGKIIIEQSIEHVPKSFQITLKNPCDEEIQWWINEKALEPFELEKQLGTLKGFAQKKLKVYLYNDNVGVFERELQFFINKTNLELTKPYLKILVKASANYPELYFDRPYVIMPVVRVGEKSVAGFQIINGGYENLHLKHIICQQSTFINFQVNYTSGSNLSITKKSLPISLSFRAEKPISFTYKLDFYDHHNRVFSIFVSGTSDNSLYTIPESEWNNNFEKQIQGDCMFLKNYLNCLGFVEQPLYDFPNSLADSDYEGLQKLLVFENPAFEKFEKMRIGTMNANVTYQNIKKNSSFPMKTSEIYDYLNEIIRFLKAEGAFLSEIRPEFLMKESQFAEIIGEKAQNSRLPKHYNLPTEENFECQRKKSWIIFLYQIFKVCSKVPTKKKSNDFWSQFPLKQRTIIQWLENCYQSEAKIDELRCSNDLKDLGDGEMLSALITKYTNIKVTEIYGRNNFTYKEKEKKCKKIIDTFSQIGIASGVKAEDLLKSKPRQMLVFLSRLYTILPSYLQKGDPITFSCAMGQTLIKSIEIKNPSKQAVTYVAKIEGSKAYAIQGDEEFTIEGKKKHQISIKYISNVDLNKNNGTLTLTGKTSAKFTPSTFIFVLKSNSLGRISEKHLQITTQLYESYDFEVQIKNRFNNDANFNVQVMSATSVEPGKNLYCSLKSIKVRKGQILPVVFTFFPFIMETHKYLILFKDPKVGEFQYQLTGIVEQPPIINDPIRISQLLFTSKQYNIDIYIPLKNQLLMKARKHIEANYEKIYRKNISNTNVGASRRSQQKLEEMAGLFPALKPDVYSVSLIPQNQMITLKNSTLTFDAEDEESNGNSRKISLLINMKVPVKDGILYLVLKNQSKTDIRRYKLCLNSVYKPLKYQMEMRVPVNQSLTQPLPLINISNDPNTFNVSFISNAPTTNSTIKSMSASNSSANNPAASIFYFNNQSQIILKPREHSTIQLIFNPKQQQQYNGLVKIENITSGQLVEYDVIAIGEEPVAESIEYSQETLDNKKYEIKLPFSKPQRYNVTKFQFTSSNNLLASQQFVHSYDKTFFINNESNSLFKFQFRTKIPGVYSAKLHIEEESKIHAFHVMIKVTENIIGEININSVERQIEHKQIPIKAGKWKIEHNDPNIEIPSEIQLQQDGVLKFSYFSMKTGIFNASHIILRNNDIGHSKYLLNVQISEQPESILDFNRVTLGKKAQKIVKLYNPDDDLITIEGVSSNPNCFYFKQCYDNSDEQCQKSDLATRITKEQITWKPIIIPSKKSIYISLVYRPSSLDQQEIGKIGFTSNTNQKWKYELRGRGCLGKLALLNHKAVKQGEEQEEEPFEVSAIEAQVHKQVFLSISFMNPLKNTVQAHVFIENLDEFRLVHENNKMTLSYLEEVQIPVKFYAQSVGNYTGKIKVLVNENVYWIYQIKANVFCQCLEESKTIKVACREKKQITLDFALPYHQIHNKKQSFQCCLLPNNKNINKESKKENLTLIKKTVRIVKNWVEEDTETKQLKCYFTLNFMSYRPFSLPILFQLMQNNSPRWIYRGQIQFLTPPFDDQFEIVTEINKPQTVGFRLNNRVKAYGKYNAYFTSDSDIEFSINPKHGELQPYGRQGTLIEVTFSPTQYKNSWQGKIIIETQQSYWSYVVKGSLPHYNPPVGKTQIPKNSRVTNK